LPTIDEQEIPAPSAPRTSSAQPAPPASVFSASLSSLASLDFHRNEALDRFELESREKRVRLDGKSLLTRLTYSLMLFFVISFSHY
jgi:hypothetical protein